MVISRQRHFTCSFSPCIRHIGICSSTDQQACKVGCRTACGFARIISAAGIFALDIDSQIQRSHTADGWIDCIRVNAALQQRSNGKQIEILDCGMKWKHRDPAWRAISQESAGWDVNQPQSCKACFPQWDTLCSIGVVSYIHIKRKCVGVIALLHPTRPPTDARCRRIGPAGL